VLRPGLLRLPLPGPCPSRIIPLIPPGGLLIRRPPVHRAHQALLTRAGFTSVRTEEVPVRVAFRALDD
jgi:hypothetical protein